MRPTTSILLTTCLIVPFSILFFSIHPAQAAPATYVPVTVTQPDGTELNLFASGDEYYNWLHDANGYTVIQDPDTAYYVYADLADGELVPTALIPERDDPAAAGLVPQLNVAPERREEIRREFLALAPEQISNAPSTGTINNLVIFIRFSGEAEPFGAATTYTGMLNTGTSSLKSYYLEASYSALTINSQLFPTPGSNIVSYQDSHARGYFQPYSVTNTIGYSGGDNGSERRIREHTLLRDAVASINLAEFPSGAAIDADGDNLVDDATFIISGSPTGWSSLLWPHAWSLYTYNVNINGKRVYDYNFQLQSMTNVGVLAHETFHVIGAPDLYHYTSNGIQPVGAWDLMENQSSTPQHMGCYMKWRYGGWISNIPEITAEGTYGLSPMGSSGQCLKIDSPNSASEYFVVEYRQRAGTFESSLPGTGLLVYRINPVVSGNAGGPPDEVYIYRPGGINPTTNGTVNQAYYSAEAGRTTINDGTSPSSFLSDGSPGGLDIDTIGSAGATISFQYGGSGGVGGFEISGNAGTPGATLSCAGCSPQMVTADGSGHYSLNVPSGWSGAVTPSKADYAFTPDHRDYADVTADQLDQDFAAAIQTPTIEHVYPGAGATNICLRPQVGVNLMLAPLVRLPSGAFNPAAVTLKLDNVVHTNEARITQTASQPATQATILYTPPANLSAGTHQGSFIYPSTGGPVTYSWYFTVVNAACPSAAPPEAPLSNVLGAEVPPEPSTKSLELAATEPGEGIAAAAESGESITAAPESGEVIAAADESGEDIVAAHEQSESITATPESGESVAAAPESGEGITTAAAETGESIIAPAATAGTGVATPVTSGAAHGLPRPGLFWMLLGLMP